MTVSEAIEKTKLLLRNVSEVDLWREIARRYDLRWGTIQMKFHGGTPIDFAEVGLRQRVSTGEQRKIKSN